MANKSGIECAMVLSADMVQPIIPGTVAPEENRARAAAAHKMGGMAGALTMMAMRGKFRAGEDDDSMEGVSAETRAAFPNSDSSVLAFAQNMGCKAPREVVMAACDMGDLEMMCRASSMEKMPWDTELVNHLIRDGDLMTIGWMHGNSQKDGVAWAWDASTCNVARECLEEAIAAAKEAREQGKEPKKTARTSIILWMHGELKVFETKPPLTPEEQPCAGACGCHDTPGSALTLARENRAKYLAKQDEEAAKNADAAKEEQEPEPMNE